MKKFLSVFLMAIICCGVLAAEDAKAQYNLGVCYETGRGVEQDIKKAVELFRKAADQGHAMAQYNLGHCYRTGEGVEKDIKKAAEWYRKAADQGYEPAKATLKKLGY